MTFHWHSGGIIQLTRQNFTIPTFTSQVSDVLLIKCISLLAVLGSFHMMCPEISGHLITLHLHVTQIEDMFNCNLIKHSIISFCLNNLILFNIYES